MLGLPKHRFEPFVLFNGVEEMLGHGQHDVLIV